MAYEIGELPLQTLLPIVARAEDQLARLDEIVRRSPVGAGFIERGHFFDTAAGMWVSGELVHVEDLVLHDAHMDIRAPTHELTIAHTILRARRRIAGAEPDWAISDRGVASLTRVREPARSEEGSVSNDRKREGDEPADADEVEPLAAEFAHIDAVLERSERLIGSLIHGSASTVPERRGIAVGDLVIRDPDWDETDRLSQWRSVQMAVEDMPPVLAAVLLFDAWEALEPMQRQHWLGGLLVSAYLRYRGKVTSHLPAFNVGLKGVTRERRRARDRTTRLLAFLDGMSVAADAGLKEIIRLQQARGQMERKLHGRRTSSSLPTVIELILARPMVSASMVAQAARVTQRGALNLITEIGAREMTGRRRYRAWGII
jgi:hypothetical protein